MSGGWLSLADRRRYWPLVEAGRIERPRVFRFGRPPVADGWRLKSVARDDALADLGRGPPRRTQTSIAREWANGAEADAEGMAYNRELQRAHRKLAVHARDFRAAVAMLIAYWGSMTHDQRCRALATIGERAGHKGNQDIALTCFGLCAGPSDQLDIPPPMSGPPSTAAERLTVPLGRVADWAFAEAFDL